MLGNLTLVLTSIDRVAYVDRFFRSLETAITYSCEFRKVQLIFVDQSDGLFAEQLLAARNIPNVDLIVLNSPKVSLSEARNLALQRCRGEYLAFPDDDCEYPMDILEQLAESIRNWDSNCVGVAYSYPGCSLVGNRRVGPNNLLGSVISFSFFVKAVGHTFDEELGVGNYFGAGEETAFLLTHLENHSYIEFSDAIFIKHPDRTGTSLERTISYSRGFGALASIYLDRTSKDIFAMAVVVRLLFAPLLKLLLYPLYSRSFYEGWADLEARWKGFYYWRSK